MKYIEIFAGIGGFRKSIESLQKDNKLNFKCVGFSENDTYALKSYAANFSLNGEVRMNDITTFVSQEQNIHNLPNFDLMVGGFPCQAFSLIGKKKGFDDARGSILFSVEEILKIKQPNFIILENVRHIEKHDNGETLKHILSFFKENGYNFTETVVLDTQKFSLPQRRRRIFIVCSKKSLNIDLSEKAIVENFNKIKNKSLLKFNDVLEVLDKQVEPKYYLSERIKHTILADGSKNYRGKSQIDLTIARTLTATMVKMHRACQDNYYSDDFILNGFSNKETPKETLLKTPVRKLTPKEALNLQGFESDFFKNAIMAGVSEHQLYKQAGNALSVNTGYALLHYLFVKNQIHK
jgi:DNA (cytosine-5)-methyltransferase 1